MFTRCPSCQSTFRVTATVLQMAQGEVRCGACGGVFNALQTLVDDWNGIDVKPAGGSEAAASPAIEDAESAALSDRDTLEFDVPENQWQQFFVSPKESEPAHAARPEPALGAAFDAVLPVEATADEEAELPELDAGVRSPEPSEGFSLEEETADADTWEAFLRETAEPSDAGNDDSAGEDGPAFIVDDGREEPVIEAPPESVAAPLTSLEPITPTTPAPPSGPRDTVLDWSAPPAFTASALAPPGHTGRWLAASAVALVVLAGQVMHHFRDNLAADPSYGAGIRATYERAGIRLHPDWPIEAYEIRGVKAIAENSAPGVLDIVAEIAVTGDQPVGLPMVRVVLRDRWSNIVASGVFPASRYLDEAAPAAQVYAPGSLIPVQITLKDPGSTAQGYELDICVPSRTLGLRCKSARDPFRS